MLAEEAGRRRRGLTIAATAATSSSNLPEAKKIWNGGFRVWKIPNSE